MLWSPLIRELGMNMKNVVYAVIMLAFAAIAGAEEEVPFVTITDDRQGPEGESLVLSLILDESRNIKEFSWTFYLGEDRDNIERETFTHRRPVEFEVEGTKAFNFRMSNFSPTDGVRIILDYLYDYFSEEWRSMEFELVARENGEWILIGEDGHPIRYLYIVPRYFLFWAIGIERIDPSYYY